MVRRRHPLRSSDNLTICLRCIGIKRNDDTYFSACLLSKNETRVEVQLGFELVNLNREYSKRTGKADGFCVDCKVKLAPTGTLREFRFIDDCCEARLLPRSKIASPDNGFLKDDHFLVRLDMRVKREDNEICSVTVKKRTATCQVIFPSMVDALLFTLEMEFSGS